MPSILINLVSYALTPLIIYVTMAFEIEVIIQRYRNDRQQIKTLWFFWNRLIIDALLAPWVSVPGVFYLNGENPTC